MDSSDRHNPEKSSAQWLYLLVIGATLPFGEIKNPIGSGLSLLLVRWLKRHLKVTEEVKAFESNECNASLVHTLLDRQSKTLQTRFVGLPSLIPFNKATILHCTCSMKNAACLTITSPHASINHNLE